MTGDFMFSMAFNIAIKLGKLDILSIINKTAMLMTEGQVRELACTGKWNITEEEYFKIISLKTGELLSVSCEAAAVVADADKKIMQALKGFGLNMGIAFQVIDDLLDYSASEEEFGKPVGKDFKEGKITLPLIYTISGMKDNESDKFEALLVNGSDKDEDYDELINVVRKSGNIEKTKKVAREYVEKAAEYLENFPVSSYRDDLSFLNDYMLERLY